MNEIEAKSKIKHRIGVIREIAGNDNKSVEDLEIAIQVLKEIREYREIGTVEELKAFKSDDFTQDLLNMGYTKGLKDGYEKAIDEFAKWCYVNGIDFSYMRKATDTESFVTRVVKKFNAEQMKGGATDE